MVGMWNVCIAVKLFTPTHDGMYNTVLITIVSTTLHFTMVYPIVTILHVSPEGEIESHSVVSRDGLQLTSLTELQQYHLYL